MNQTILACVCGVKISLPKKNPMHVFQLDKIIKMCFYQDSKVDHFVLWMKITPPPGV